LVGSPVNMSAIDQMLKYGSHATRGVEGGAKVLPCCTRLGGGVWSFLAAAEIAARNPDSMPDAILAARVAAVESALSE